MDVLRWLRPLARAPRWGIFGLALTGLLLQAFGLYWDVWRHVVIGRETFFTPPHLVLYAGFGYVALAGIIGCIAGAAAPGWAGPRVHVVGLLIPVEFLLIAAGALFQAAAFPWDEAWHRLVAEGLVAETYWSPPHVMAIAGGILSAFGFLTATVLERGRWRGARNGLGLAAIALGAGLLLFAVQVLLGPLDFATTFNGQVLRDAIAYPTAVSLATPAVLVIAILASRRPGVATLTAAVYTGIRSLMVIGDFAFPPPVVVLAPLVDLVFFVLGTQRFRLVAATLTGGVWAVVFYVAYLLLRGLSMDPLFVALFSFTVFIAGSVSASFGFGVGRIVQSMERIATTPAPAAAPIRSALKG
jgi:hypothetical protein